MVNANTELVLSKRQEPDTLRENHSLFFSSRNATASAPPDGFQPVIPSMRHVKSLRNACTLILFIVATGYTFAQTQQTPSVDDIEGCLLQYHALCSNVVLRIQESCSETNVLDVFPMYLAGWLHSEEAMPEKIIFHKHHEENHFHNGLFSFFCPFCDTCDFASV